MPFEGSLFLYLYLGLIAFLTLLGLGFYYFKRRYGNILFLSEGKVELSSDCRLTVKKVLPFMGEGYLIFVEIETPSGRYFEVWGYSKSGGFVKISKIGD